MFTDSSISFMVDSLVEFHVYKQSVTNAGLHRGTSGPIDHFKIPKLKLLASPLQFTMLGLLSNSQRTYLNASSSPTAKIDLST